MLVSGPAQLLLHRGQDRGPLGAVPPHFCRIRISLVYQALKGRLAVGARSRSSLSRVPSRLLSRAPMAF